MLKETIKYIDFNGNERTEDFYFHLTKAEITEWELSVSGGMSVLLTKLSAKQDIPNLIKLAKELILKAYGEKSDDGKRFMKKAPDGHLLADDFAETEAFSQLYMRFVTDADYGSKFANGIMPADMPKAANPQ